MTFIFRNKTIIWDISKWNRGQTKWDGGNIFLLKCIKTFRKYLINKGLFRYRLLLKIENTVAK